MYSFKIVIGVILLTCSMYIGHQNFSIYPNPQEEGAACKSNVDTFLQKYVGLNISSYSKIIFDLT